MTKPNKLLTLIDFLRRQGVLQYKGALDGALVELTLLPEKPAKPIKEPKRSKNDLFEPSIKKGADGLTAEEQETLYGRVLDAKD